MSGCMCICENKEKFKNTRPISRNTGHLPRCIECGFAFSEDLGQIRCGCCNRQLRRATR